jgi:MFS family permease
MRSLPVRSNLLCALGFLLLANAGADEIWPAFVVLFLLGTARAFWGPAAQSLAPNIVPPEALANAITANASAWQFASIMGPALGGLLYGQSPQLAFGTAGALLLVAIVMVSLIPKPAQHRASDRPPASKPCWEASATSFRAVWCSAPCRSTCSP